VICIFVSIQTTIYKDQYVLPESRTVWAVLEKQIELYWKLNQNFVS